MSFISSGCKHDPVRVCDVCIRDLDARLSKLEMQKFGESYSMFHGAQQPIVWPTAPRPTGPSVVFVMRDTSPRRRVPDAKTKAVKKPMPRKPQTKGKAKASGKTPKTKTVRGDSGGRPWETAGSKPKKTKAKQVRFGQTTTVKPEYKS